MPNSAVGISASRVNPVLAQANGSIFNDRAFVCLNGRRHLVTDADRLAAYGLRWPDDLVSVDEDFLLQHRPAQMLPRLWSENERVTPPAGLTGRDLREIAAAVISGTGMEIGALASPFPAPIHCNLIYGDVRTHAELIARYPNEPADDMVIPTIKTEFETLEGVNDGSLDFILASHVIEHTRDPIGAIVNTYAKLRKGGHLVLVVPDMRRTLDRYREMTSLDHLIEDFRSPSHERDALHHQEFHRLAIPAAQDEYDAAWRVSWDSRRPIHYHTWVYEAFDEMISWIRREAAPFSSVWSHPTLPHEQNDFEFYFTMTK